ncbi:MULTISPECIES: hypothetical protein [Vibrio]|uniref:hypothetical protein n=1 Tax=Vibrio TaxID=662 RepID=UPI0029655AFE|nr:MULTISPECIES: hypothetical protein [unclassified Vibrio]MDW1590264.1 hypothetical protein [Vibrio sp. Vb2944]MDW1609326.1 hypothetical protein [Vibrio sp. Vb2908]MDW1723813.1 hypothetical protein [Vibrio sp. Vb2909]MDW2069567.1 hypothetical protein [Vibrio sp. 2096]MDW3140328.1 hypothetical protein [Vibrio sp. 2094]
MIEKLKLACEAMGSRYANILSQYYPAHGSTGFTERNLTNNLVIALERAFGEACISWFEAPICLKDGKHIDAVVFYENITILIEAKRLTSVKQQMGSIERDVERMFSTDTIKTVEKELRSNQNQRRRYSVVLADVWTENDEKTNVYKSWPSLLPAYFLENLLFSTQLSFDDLCVEGKWKDNYKILVAVSEIKAPQYPKHTAT